MKIKLEIEAESSKDVQNLQHMLTGLSSDLKNNTVKTTNAISNHQNESLWEWAMSESWRIKTRMRAIEMIRVIHDKGTLGCAQIVNMLSDNNNYQTVRNQLIDLVKNGALDKKNAKYFLTKRAAETFERCQN